MIGGLLADLLVLAAIALFAWAGAQLGGVASVSRTLASLVAFAIAALLRDPVGRLLEAMLGTSDDFARLLAMLLVGVGAYIAVTSLLRYATALRAARRFVDDEKGDDFATDPLDRRGVAMAAGGILGLVWVLAFVVMLMLLPADNFISRSAARSVPGNLFIAQEGVLRWVVGGFPHYTQTQPKGEFGAVVGERGSIPLQGDEEPRLRPRDAEVLLDEVNRMRTRRGVSPLGFNPDVSAVAERHASSLVSESRLSVTPPGGGQLQPRVLAALGEAAPGLREEVGTVVAWAHTPGTAMAGMGENDDAARELADGSWSEIGIGVADAGWYDGRVYVLILVGPIDADDDADGADEDAGDAADGEVDPAEPTAPTDEAPSIECEEPFDLDGDGVPDAASVDPDFACPQEPGEEPLSGGLGPLGG
jgi:uncharacterized protein YkwD